MGEEKPARWYGGIWKARGLALALGLGEKGGGFGGSPISLPDGFGPRAVSVTRFDTHLVHVRALAAGAGDFNKWALCTLWGLGEVGRKCRLFFGRSDRAKSAGDFGRKNLLLFRHEGSLRSCVENNLKKFYIGSCNRNRSYVEFSYAQTRGAKEIQMTKAYELETGVLFQSAAAPKRLLSHILDGWHGRPFAGKMIEVARGECWVTGADLGVSLEPAKPECFAAWTLGRELRANWQAGHRLEYRDGRVFAVPPHPHGACGCTICQKR